MVDSESNPRPRRTRHDSAKHYDAARKDLQLAEVLDMLQCYVDYGGGINCCVCGKLYKSRVCFIKHLWEHTIYWDLFAGDKNHMRVLSIQAALILYGTCQQPLRPIPVDSLLVTSPHSSEHGTDGKLSGPDAASAWPRPSSSVGPKPFSVEAKPVPSSASRKSSVTDPKDSSCKVSFASDAAKKLPLTPTKKSTVPLHVPKAPVKKNVPCILKRKAPPRLDLGIPSKISAPECPAKKARVPLNDSPSPLMASAPLPFLHTPVKQKIPRTMPKTPRKKNKGRQDSCDFVADSSHRRVSRFFLPAGGMTSDDRCWKETDSCACKRKRAE